MPKRTLLFAPAAFNLAETSRMVEIAKAVEGLFRYTRHPNYLGDLVSFSAEPDLGKLGGRGDRGDDAGWFRIRECAGPRFPSAREIWRRVR